MTASNVLISGMRGLGVEIGAWGGGWPTSPSLSSPPPNPQSPPPLSAAKNVVLGGVKSVTIHDDTVTKRTDLGAQYFLREEDVDKKTRAEATKTHLAELNSYVPIHVHTGPLSEEVIRQHQVVVLTTSSLDEQKRINAITHPNKIGFIVAENRGLFG